MHRDYATILILAPALTSPYATRGLDTRLAYEVMRRDPFQRAEQIERKSYWISQAQGVA